MGWFEETSSTILCKNFLTDKGVPPFKSKELSLLQRKQKKLPACQKNYKKDKNYNILDSLYIYHYILLLTNFYCILSTHKMSSKSVHEWDDLKRQARLFFVKIFSLKRKIRFSS